MIKLDIRADVKGITASLNRYVGEQQKAVVRALNKTAAEARTEASKQVRAAGYNIKASAIKKSFSIKRASAGNLVVMLKSTGQQIGLINYDARPTKSGVSAQVKGGRQIFRHAFIVRMKNGHSGVFERTGPARVKGATMIVMVNGKSKRIRANLPIREMMGPSIPTALANATVEKALMAKIREKFPKILRHELEFASMKAK